MSGIPGAPNLGMVHGQGSNLMKQLVQRKLGGGSGISEHFGVGKVPTGPKEDKPLESDVRKSPLLPKVFGGYR